MQFFYREEILESTILLQSLKVLCEIIRIIHNNKIYVEIWSSIPIFSLLLVLSPRSQSGRSGKMVYDASRADRYADGWWFVAVWRIDRSGYRSYEGDLIDRDKGWSIIRNENGECNKIVCWNRLACRPWDSRPARHDHHENNSPFELWLLDGLLSIYLYISISIHSVHNQFFSTRNELLNKFRISFFPKTFSNF